MVAGADGYAETTKHPKVKNSTTAQASIRLKRIFLPNVEIVTARSTYQGVLVSRSPELVTIEVRPGIMQSFARDEIRDIKFLNPEK